MKTYRLILSDGTKVIRDLEEKDILDGYLSEAKAFEIFFDAMIMCNNYTRLLGEDNIDYLVSSYVEEEDYYVDEYQYFIIDFSISEELMIEVVKSIGNTLYYDEDMSLYIMGVTDFGTSRTGVQTNIKCEEIKEQA